MCDINAGQLILCFSRHDPAAQNVLTRIRHEQIEHVTYGESMAAKLEKAGLKPDPSLEYELHLVNVPEGQENWKSHFLQFFYKHALLEVLPELAKDQQRLNAVLGRSSHQ